MKTIIFALFFALISTNIFAGNNYTSITKKELKTNYAKEASALKKDLVKKEQVALQQTKDSHYKAIVVEVKNAINKSLEISEQTYQKYKDNPHMQPEYINSFKQDIKAYKDLQQSDAAIVIADYAKKNFDITKINNLHALCFSSNQITLDFEYQGKKARIIFCLYEFLSDIVFFHGYAIIQ